MNATPSKYGVRGEVFIWLLLVMVIGFGALIIWAGVQSNEAFKEECAKAGGVPVISRGSQVCYEAGSVKFAR
jgi:hypothetical protein